MRLTLFFLILLTSLGLKAQTNIPFIENFDGQTNNWSTSGNLNVWKRGIPSQNQINSAYSGTKAWMTDTLNNYTLNRLDAVQSPLFNFSNVSQAPYLRFKYNMKTEACCDYVRLQYTLDDQNWVTVGSHNTGQNWYNDSTVNYWSGNSNGWKIASHELDGIPLTQNVRFRFLFFSDYSQTDEGFAFDDFEFRQAYTDAGISELIQPTTDACSYSNAESISVELENLGQAALNNLNVSYQLDSNNIVTEVLPQIAADTSIQFVFNQGIDISANGIYNLKIWVDAANDNYVINDTLSTTISNLQEIDQYPYFTDFELGQEEWKTEGEKNTWTFGEPMKSKIRGANSGQNAWVTGNTGFGLYNNNEQSFVLSPCFNSSSLSSAQISMAIWWESESDYDGANIQYTLNDGLSWQNLSNSNSVNWYNNSQIDGLQFSGGTEGWSGNQNFNEGSEGYVSARIRENQLIGNSSLRFRVNFGSDINTRDEGIAFDDFYFGEIIATDLAILSSNKLRYDLCQTESDSLFATIQNSGVNNLNNFTIKYEFGNNSDSVVYNSTLNAGADDEIFLGLIQATDTGEFDIKVYHNIAADGFNQNDTLSIPLSVYVEKPAPVASNVQICDSSRALLIANGDGLTRWYSDAVRENLVFVGDTFLTGSITKDSTFYIDNSRGSIDTLGPIDNTIGNGSYTNVDSRTRIQIDEFTSILSAKTFASGIGDYDVSLEDLDGNVLYNKTYFTSSPTQRIYLGFDLAAGEYILRVHNFSGATLFRNTSGATYGAYSNDYVSILGNNFDPEFYYYLYDLRVSNSEPCAGEADVQVTRGNIQPQANFSFDRVKNRFVLNNRSQSSQSFTWIFENLSAGTIDSSTQVNPVVFLDSGSYTISLIARSSCGVDTLTRNFEINEISAVEVFERKEKYQLALFPNPAREYFNWKTEAPSSTYQIRVYDIMGREVYKKVSESNKGRIFTQNWESGYYIISVKGKDLEFRSKLIVN